MQENLVLCSGNNRIYFRPTGSDCYEVSGDFPRLCRSKVNAVIARAEYKIFLHGLSDFIVDNGIEEFLNGV
jgi:hypothetical protein